MKERKTNPILKQFNEKLRKSLYKQKNILKVNLSLKPFRKRLKCPFGGVNCLISLGLCNYCTGF